MSIIKQAQNGFYVELFSSESEFLEKVKKRSGKYSSKYTMILPVRRVVSLSTIPAKTYALLEKLLLKEYKRKGESSLYSAYPDGASFVNFSPHKSIAINRFLFKGSPHSYFQCNHLIILAIKNPKKPK